MHQKRSSISKCVRNPNKIGNLQPNTFSDDENSNDRKNRQNRETKRVKNGWSFTGQLLFQHITHLYSNIHSMLNVKMIHIHRSNKYRQNGYNELHTTV